MKSNLIQILYIILIHPWLKYIIGVTYTNQSILKKTKQFILVANHNSHFDTISIISTLPMGKLKSTHSVAVNDYFGKTFFSKLAVQLFFNSILIKKNVGKNEESALKQMDSVLKNGKSLLLFPEGTRGKPGVLADFKHGVAVLLKQNPEIPFIPIFLEGFGKVLPKSKKLILPLNCNVRFGEAIYPNSADVADILGEVKAEVLKLKGKDNRLYPEFENI